MTKKIILERFCTQFSDRNIVFAECIQNLATLGKIEFSFFGYRPFPIVFCIVFNPIWVRDVLDYRCPKLLSLWPRSNWAMSLHLAHISPIAPETSYSWSHNIVLCHIKSSQQSFHQHQYLPASPILQVISAGAWIVTAWYERLKLFLRSVLWLWRYQDDLWH